MNHAPAQCASNGLSEFFGLTTDCRGAADGGPWASARFDADALAYLERQEWAGTAGLGCFLAQTAEVCREHAIDEALAAILLHGERRRDDRWLATATRPLPMPNRRRPPPIVAAAEVIDVGALHDDLAHVYVPHRQRCDVSATARLLGLRVTTAVEQRDRRYIARHMATDAEPKSHHGTTAVSVG